MRRWWVILLLVALLPLRAWAVAELAAPTLLVPGAAGPAAAEGMPCHAGLHDPGVTAPQDAPAVSLHPCVSCDLCQAPLALPADASSALVPALATGPQVARDRDTGRVLATGPERPPRA